MRVTIIKGDNAVIVNGERHEVDCNTLPPDFHALQWAGDAGEVEYSPVRCGHCGARSKKSNEFIRDLSPYQPYIDAWTEAKTAAEQAAALFAQAPQEAGADAAGPQG